MDLRYELLLVLLVIDITAFVKLKERLNYSLAFNISKRSFYPSSIYLLLLLLYTFCAQYHRYSPFRSSATKADPACLWVDIDC